MADEPTTEEIYARFTPTTEQLRALWLDRVYAGPSEKIEFERGFETWLLQQKRTPLAEPRPTGSARQWGT